MEIPRHWRLKAQRYRLEGSTCPTCLRLIFPPRSVCPYCHVKMAQRAERIIPILMPLTTPAEAEEQIDITERLLM